jgi:hypothetical protein
MLQKASQHSHPLHVGMPPRVDEESKLVLPRPTHRPCSRPGDAYIEQRQASRGQQPLISATRLTDTPTIDGRLDDKWLQTDRNLTLRESFDGSESMVMPSIAWVGYDQNALYVAARHPVQDTHSLRDRTHLTAPTDYMELAFGSHANETLVLNLKGHPDGHFEVGEPGDLPLALLNTAKKSVTYRAGFEAEAWVCEWRLPFSACGFTPRESPLLAFNLAVRHGDGDTWAVWRETGGAPREVHRAGTLLFPTECAATESFSKQGLVAWFDAAEAATIQMDSDARVSKWKDKSGCGRHAVQESTAFRPTMAATGLNGRPALRFNERAHTRLEVPDLAPGKADVTVVAVISNPKPGLPQNHDARIFTASNGQSYDYLTGVCCSISGTETGGPRLILAQATSRWAQHVRIGCFSPAYQTFFKGLIAEILVYDRRLPRNELNDVCAYLTCKWEL